MSESENSAKIKSATEEDSTPSGKYRRWKTEITKAEKEFDNFITRGRTTVRRYKDERDAADGSDKKFNIFTANVGILQSSLYAKIPKVKVGRRFKQYMDDVARVASMMLENCVMQDIDEPECDFDQVLRDAVEDRLVPGMGTAWLRLESETEERTLEEVTDDLTGEVIQEAATYDVLTRQEIMIEHVFWEDFLYSPCRTWKERRWVGRRVYMDKDALTKRFGKEKADRIPLDHNPKSQGGASNEPQNEVFQKAIIYEIWDRQHRQVLWLSKGFEELLDERDDPLHLEDFEPCPKPLFALTTTSNCVPVNDFVIYQDQYNELDQVNNRISLLVAACKVVGVYDSSATGLQRMLQEGNENTLIPVDNWAMFAEKGGIKGSIDWLPLDSVIQALEKLRQSRDDIKGQIYELTGISDIVRGNTKASETLGAQNIKAQFAGVRIQKLQNEVARFAQDILRIKAELICRHVAPEQIIKMSNFEHYLDGQNAQLVHQAIALLKGEHEKFEWRVNVQADSLAQADYTQDKADKVEFTNAVATFLQSAATTMKAIPDSAPILFETLKYVVSGFKGAQELEGVIDQTLEKIMEKIKNPPPPPPDPAVEKAKMEMTLSKEEAQLDAHSKQQDMLIKREEFQMDAAAQQRELEMQATMHQQELAFKRQEHMLAMQQQNDKFSQQLAISEQKARQQIVENAREDNEKEQGNEHP